MDIKRRVRNLVKKYHTRNPYELASYLKIEIVLTPMPPHLHGFYDRVLRKKFIVINSELEPYRQRQTCAHELGHSQLHKGWGYYFMIEHTFFSPGRFEREANEFAWLLLFDEESCRVEYDNDLSRYVREEGIVDLVGYRRN
ncbi:MAG TPA: ImmA/IrrE family metallo-endopeptidase [Methanosarcina sp.]